MKYVPKLIDEENNYSKGSDWWYGVRIFVKLMLALFAVYIFLGIIVDFVVPYIPISWENYLAGPIMAEAISKSSASKKYNLTEIQNLLEKLAAKLDDKYKRKFRVMVIEEKEANALALPGGNIVLYSKLLDEAGSENELAMILAHELGHFAHRDHLRGLGRSFLFFIVSTAILGGSNPAAKSFLNSSGVLTNTYSRSQEFRADRFALDLLVKTYGHAGGSIDFFNRLQKKETFAELTQYLSTHPASKYRIKAIQSIIDAKGYKLEDTLPVSWLKAEVQ
jgi:predicted Zn-dependent protease